MALARVGIISGLLAALSTTASHAQYASHASSAARVTPWTGQHDSAPITLPVGFGAARDAWWAPLASAVVPGVGQVVLHQDRAVAYVAVEAYLIARYVSDRRETRNQRTAYRDLAKSVARALFAQGGLPEGSFDYYENMEHYLESGVFSLSPVSVEPEEDSTTFNGAMWRLARETYWKNPEVAPAPDSPEYQRAIGFYLRRAVRPEFRWSWRNAQLEHDVYIRTIAASNRAFHRSIADLGALLANHALSTVDAYVTLRLRMHARGQDGTERSELSASVPWPRW